MSRQEDFIEAGIAYRMEHGRPMAIGGGNFAEMTREMNRTKPFEAGCEYGYQYALQHHHQIPVEKTNNTINVFFRKEQDGWHTYIQYGIDLPTGTAIEFGENIAKAVDLLNGKEVTNE